MDEEKIKEGYKEAEKEMDFNKWISRFNMFKSGVEFSEKERNKEFRERALSNFYGDPTPSVDKRIQELHEQHKQNVAEIWKQKRETIVELKTIFCAETHVKAHDKNTYICPTSYEQHKLQADKENWILSKCIDCGIIDEVFGDA